MAVDYTTLDAHRYELLWFQSSDSLILTFFRTAIAATLFQGSFPSLLNQTLLSLLSSTIDFHALSLDTTVLGVIKNTLFLRVFSNGLVGVRFFSLLL